MTTVGPVPPALPPVPTPTATTGATGAVGLGAVPNPSAPTVTANAVQALTAIVVNLPNTLRNRPVGSPIVGTLVAQDSNGTALLRTAEGIVVLRGPIAAQIGSQLALYLPDQAEGATARLVLQRMPDGTPATGVTAGNTAQASAAAPDGGSSAAVAATPQRPAPTLSPGQVVTATLVQRGEGAPTGATGYARAPIGAAFEARVLSIANAAGAPAQGGAMGINADGHPVVTATVVGRTSAGLVAINAGFGLLTVPAGGDLQPGQRLELELIGRPATTAPSNAPAQAVVATLAQRGDPALASANAVAAGYARAPIGTTIQTNVLSIANADDDGSSAGTVSVNAQGNPVVTATVTGRTGAGLVAVNAGFGQLTLPAALNLLAGQRLEIELVGRPGVAPGAPAPNAVVTATLIQRGDAPAPAGAGPAAPGPAAGYARAAIGTTFDARIVSPAPTGGDAPRTGSIAVNAEGHPVVTASVVGRTGGGLTVVNAGFGLLTLPAGGNLPPGQPVALELLGRPSPPADAPDTGQLVTATLVQRGDQAPATGNAIAQTYARAPIGTTIEARLLLLAGATDDGVAAGSVTVNAEGNPVVTATVAGRTGAGLLVVNAGFGLMTVGAAGNAEPGQRVQLELVGRVGAPSTALTPGQVVPATLVQRGDAGPVVVNGAASGYVRAPIGAAFDARVLAIGGGEAAANIGQMSINAEGHPVVTATVVGRSAGGLLVVNAGFGLLTIPAGDLPVGQRIQLELLGRPGLATIAGAAARPGGTPLAGDEPAAAGDAVTLARDWENLRRAIDGLAASDPAAAQAALGRAVAQPGPRLAAGLLFLVAALRGGDVGMLLGERAARALERTGRGAVLGRLGEELGVLNRLATQPTGDWRAFFLPVQHPEGPITPVRLFFRQQRNRKGQLEPTTRFVVETELTRLGPLQIDGLARAQRVDLVLRTREALPEDARRDIDAIVQSAAAEGRFAGSVAFQAGGRFPIDPLDEIAHPAAHGVMA
ncbi:MAG: hypothetical protein IT562_03140 [Alphaproteobacteria bacterium]|nr:hypothetical protein [Alphaproteobacteria bacterium]